MFYLINCEVLVWKLHVKIRQMTLQRMDHHQHVHHLFELLPRNQGVILFLWVLLRWMFPGRHG
jgi:hypothetical protein